MGRDGVAGDSDGEVEDVMEGDDGAMESGRGSGARAGEGEGRAERFEAVDARNAPESGEVAEPGRCERVFGLEERERGGSCTEYCSIADSRTERYKKPM